MKNFLLSILLLTPYFISAKGSRLGVRDRDLVVCDTSCSLDTDCNGGDACTFDVCDNGCCINKANPQCCDASAVGGNFDCSTLIDACNTASCVDNTCKFEDRSLCTVGKCTLDAGATDGYVCSECSVDNDCEDRNRCTINYCNKVYDENNILSARVCERESICRQEGCEGTCTLVAEEPTCAFNCVRVRTKCVVECEGTAADTCNPLARACSVKSYDTTTEESGTYGDPVELGALTCTCEDCGVGEIGTVPTCVDDIGINISTCDNDPFQDTGCCPS